MKVFRLIKKVFFSRISNFIKCKVRPEIISINSNNPIFYPFSIKINKCNGNCNNIDDPYARICVPDI